VTPVTIEAGAGEEPGVVLLVMNAPKRAGAFVWSAVARRCEIGAAVHDESEPLALTFSTRPHETSMAVWDVPSAAVAQSPVKVSVGLRCAAGCRLTGEVIEIVDEAGMTAGRGVLGESALPGTTALYWTEIEIAAPDGRGVISHRVSFSSAGPDLPHAASHASFSFRTTGRPEHHVTIEVVNKDTGAAVGEVEVALGPYLRVTDADGRLQMAIPAGVYHVSVRKDGFSAEPVEAHVTADTSLRIAGAAVPTMAEIIPNLTSFDGYPWG
jgi:hypothetical protein